MDETCPYFVAFLIRMVVMYIKSASSEQVSSHFRLNTKSLNEFVFTVWKQIKKEKN